jgi:hypothetical protein
MRLFFSIEVPVGLRVESQWSLTELKVQHAHLLLAGFTCLYVNYNYNLKTFCDGFIFKERMNKKKNGKGGEIPIGALRSMVTRHMLRANQMKITSSSIEPYWNAFLI